MPFKFIVKQNPTLEIEFEAGSIAEGLAILQDQKTALGQLAAEFGAEPAATVNTSTDSAPVAEATKGRRGRPRNQPDPATASAPPPAPVPGAPPAPSAQPAPPPVAGSPAAQVTEAAVSGGIPAFLERSPAQTAPPAPAAPGLHPPAFVAPAPVAAPPAPPPAPAAAPQFILGNKIADEVKRRTTGAVDGGKAMSEWLAGCGVVQKGATFEEAEAVLRFTKDEQLTGVAQALGVS